MNWNVSFFFLSPLDFTYFKMVKLTAELIYGAAQYMNPIKERELDLSGEFEWITFSGWHFVKLVPFYFLDYKIPVIENLGATLDQFDTINFTNNVSILLFAKHCTRSWFLRKNQHFFREINALILVLEKLLKSWFHEFFAWSSFVLLYSILYFPALCCKLISRNTFQWGKFLTFPSHCCVHTVFALYYLIFASGNP